MFYSKSTGGFYDRAIHGEDIPSDAIEITKADHASMLAGQATGKSIVGDANGRPILEDPPAPTAAQIVKALTDEVQHHLDTAAQAYGYDDIKSAVTYAEEPAVPKFQQEGIAFRAWRSLCWAYCYDVLDAVQSGERAQPEIADLIAELPALSL
jgi:hypothetical protein